MKVVSLTSLVLKRHACLGLLVAKTIGTPNSTPHFCTPPCCRFPTYRRSTFVVDMVISCCEPVLLRSCLDPNFKIPKDL
ncbi:hypothetical protein PVAP13_1KG062177 [Panicum virgatum]|uniref:Secreted protein n=1 Tax=Panicum virgatum TaxID=38727 RepID=A0A8T0XE17_PANVG|nr:hypothetical protein PVAP13_1KG062177 [Panicum virgatum]